MIPIQDLPAEAETSLKAWEDTHEKITRAISSFICEYGRMPTHTELASATGLECAAITSHLDGFTYHPSYQEEIEQLRMMTTKILAKVAYLAVSGDLNAARLYCDVVTSVYVTPPPTPPDREGVVAVNDKNIFKCHVEWITQEQRDKVEAILKAPATPPVVEDIATLNRRWEENHQKMLSSISGSIRWNRCMPTITQLAADTGLSRQTITAHLKEFTHHPLFRREIEQFRCLTPRVMAAVAHVASEGSVRAARLFFKVMKDIFPAPAMAKHEQKHYQMVNKTRMDSEILKHLSQEQRETLVAIFKSIDWSTVTAEAIAARRQSMAA